MVWLHVFCSFNVHEFIWCSHTLSIQIMPCSITFFDFPEHVFLHCIGKSLQRYFIKYKKKRTKCVQGIGVKKARESYECWRRFVAWDVSALICRCSHRDNYSHWLEFSVQFFMLVLLITIFSGHEFMNSFCLFIHFHPDIQMNVKTRFFLLANELFSEIVRRAQMDWIFRKAFQLKWKWHFISMNDDDDDDDNLFDFTDRKTQMMWFLYTQHKQEI